jgi:hypothetical protein
VDLIGITKYWNYKSIKPWMKSRYYIVYCFKLKHIQSSYSHFHITHSVVPYCRYCHNLGSQMLDSHHGCLRFNPRVVHMIFVVVLRQVLHQYSGFPPVLHNNLPLSLRGATVLTSQYIITTLVFSSGFTSDLTMDVLKVNFISICSSLLQKI